MTLAYPTGEAIRAGDRVLYDGEAGYVEFVVSERTGDAALDWFVERFPGGGAMLSIEQLGSVFLGFG